MRTVQSLVEALQSMPCHIFASECVAWAEDAGNDADPQLRAFMDAGGDPKEALNILSSISGACEHELNLTIPAPIQEVQPDGSIRCVTPMAAPNQLMPDRFSHLETLFSELRSA